MIKLGDIVRLNPLSKWNNNTKYNPIDTDGEIIEYINMPFGILVLWDNGEKNHYNKKDLVLVRSAVVEITPEVKDELLDQLNNLIEKYKNVFVCMRPESEGHLFIKTSDGLWTRVNPDGVNIGLYFSNKDMTLMRKSKLVEQLDLDKQIHIDAIKSIL